MLGYNQFLRKIAGIRQAVELGSEEPLEPAVWSGIPLRGELWKIRTPLIEKVRPALVITPGQDNATNGGAIVIPTSTGGFRSNAAMLRLKPPEAGVQAACFLLPNMLHFLEFETCVIEITDQGYKQVKDKRFKTFIKKLGDLDRDRLEDIEMYLYKLLGLSALD